MDTNILMALLGGKCIAANNKHDTSQLLLTWMMAALLFHFSPAAFGWKVGCSQSKLCLRCHWAVPEPAPKPSTSNPARRRRGRRSGGIEGVIETFNSRPDQLHPMMNLDEEGQRVSVTFACFCHCFNSSSCAELSFTPAKKRGKIQAPEQKRLYKNQLKGDAVTRGLAWMSFHVPVVHAGGRSHGCWRSKTQNYSSHPEERANSYSEDDALISWKFRWRE